MASYVLLKCMNMSKQRNQRAFDVQGNQTHNLSLELQQLRTRKRFHIQSTGDHVTMWVSHVVTPTVCLCVQSLTWALVDEAANNVAFTGEMR